MKAEIEQLNAATLAYEFGRQYAILNPGKQPPGAATANRLVNLLLPSKEALPGAVRERFQVAMRNGWEWQNAYQGGTMNTARARVYRPRECKPLPTKETLDVIAKLRAHAVKVNSAHDGRPTKNKITPSTAIGLTG